MGGTPLWVPPIGPGWGVPNGGVPHLGYTSPIRPIWGGTTTGGTPPQVPLLGPGQGIPQQGGVSHLGYPHQTWLGGTPTGEDIPLRVPPIRPGQGGTLMGGTPPQVRDGVLDTVRSVCLLRSHRRTFLFQCIFGLNIPFSNNH